MVECPICLKDVPVGSINRHLDSGCTYGLTGPAAVDSKKSDNVSIRSSPPPSTNTPAKPIASIFQQTGKSSNITQKSSQSHTRESSSPDASPSAQKRSLTDSTILTKSTSATSDPPAKRFKASEAIYEAKPLAEKMRPRTLDDMCGQELVGPNGVLRGLIEEGRVPSMILWGSAGCGKTTLARVIANTVNARFVEISATTAGVGDVKEVCSKARREITLTGRKTILFCDEIHRFSKSQQDVFLAPVESGQITLIGATTENPSFKVQSALLSRCRVFTFSKLTEPALFTILSRALDLECPPDTSTSPPTPTIPKVLDIVFLQYLSRFANGDARTALNLLELSLGLCRRNPSLTFDQLKKSLTRTILYDSTGDQHYDHISAFHKSIRGSDADAAVFWLARMLKGGEDPLFIARRMVVIASEDIGLADNTMLPLAMATMQAVQNIGMPEARINLVHCTVALAQAKKSTKAYRALNSVMEMLEDRQEVEGAPVPVHLRNAPTKFMKELGYGKEYKYNPDYKDGKVVQEYLPDEVKGSRFVDDIHLGSKIDPDLQRSR
ncbi:P-loop containing nucleoside triphosphate hydrolase protein [Ascodesmis nigricans]|uniref:P-loop containing nucleoside triphosphate hydrolase protein n=1 Tax=Ascodesmis nigricans TaxID=341454 RepID=A0A4V3SIS6_9PEZI|nr:P-loop containing nucleoside triphosphate hydrolase protein [Ascodesmis nigricans]